MCFFPSRALLLHRRLIRRERTSLIYRTEPEQHSAISNHAALQIPRVPWEAQAPKFDKFTSHELGWRGASTRLAATLTSPQGILLCT